MKRKWIIAGAVVLAAAGALPWGVGYLTETQWRQAVTEVNDAQPFLQLETEQYDRGILGARVRLTAIVTLPETHEQRRLEFLGDVSHGMTGSLMVLEPATGWAPGGRRLVSGGAPPADAGIPGLGNRPAGAGDPRNPDPGRQLRRGSNHQRRGSLARGAGRRFSAGHVHGIAAAGADGPGCRGDRGRD